MNQTAVSILEAAFFKLEHAVIKETTLNKQSKNDLKKELLLQTTDLSIYGFVFKFNYSVSKCDVIFLINNELINHYKNTVAYYLIWCYTTHKVTDFQGA